MSSDIPKLARIKQDDEAMEKLHVAARKGQTDHIRRLLGMGVNPSIANKFGCTALHLACKFNQPSVVRELAARCELSGSWHGQKPLHLAVVANNAALVDAIVEGAREQRKMPDSLLNDLDEYEVEGVGDLTRSLIGQTPLHWCVALGESHIPMVGRLLELGASPNVKDRNSETPLMRAIECDNAEAFALIVGRPAQLRLDIVDRQGRSPLHHAIRFNRRPLAKQLIELGHELTLEDQNRTSLIMLAFRAAWSSILDTIVESCDPFAVLSAPCHNGHSVVTERIEWLPFVTESDPQKGESVRVFQRRLDAINKANAPPPPEPTERKKGNKGAAAKAEMQVAPSAPYKR